MKVGDYTTKAWVAASYSPSCSCCCRRKHHCGTVLDRSSRRHLPWRKHRLWWSNGKDSYIRVFTMSCSGRQTAVLTWCVVRWDEDVCVVVCAQEKKVLNTESQKRKVKKSVYLPTDATWCVVRWDEDVCGCGIVGWISTWILLSSRKDIFFFLGSLSVFR